MNADIADTGQQCEPCSNKSTQNQQNTKLGNEK